METRPAAVLLRHRVSLGKRYNTFTVMYLLCSGMRSCFRMLSRCGLHFFLCGTGARREGGVVACWLFAFRLGWSSPHGALGCDYPAGGCMGHPLGCLRSRLPSRHAAPRYLVTLFLAAALLHGAILVRRCVSRSETSGNLMPIVFACSLY